MHAIKVLSLLCTLTLCLAQKPAAQTFNPFEQDTLIHCGSAPLQLDAGADYARYQWHTGSNTRMMEVGAPGWQHISATDFSGNTFSDSVYVVIIPYTLNGYTTTRPKREWVFNPTPDPPLRISSGIIFEGAGKFSYTATSTWTSDAIATIDSVSFFLESFAPADTIYPAGDLLIHEVQSNTLKAAGKWRVPATGGLVTVPVNFEAKAYYSYRFTFTKLNEAPAPPYGNYAYLRPGQSPTNSSPNEPQVWLHLQGRTYRHTLPGNQFHACFTDTVELQASVPGDHAIRWSTSETTDTIRVQPGQTSIYPFTIEQNGYTCHDTARVQVFRASYKAFALDSVLYCNQRQMNFSVMQPGYDYYHWRGGTGSILGSGTISQTGWLAVTAEGVLNGRSCFSTDSIHVRLLGDSIRYYQFTGDGLFSNPANWTTDTALGYWGRPPSPLRPGDRIIINTPGTCILDVDLTVTECSNIQVLNNSQLILQRQLRITR